MLLCLKEEEVTPGRDTENEISSLFSCSRYSSKNVPMRKNSSTIVRVLDTLAGRTLTATDTMRPFACMR